MTGRSFAASNWLVLKALEHCLGWRENRNLFRNSIEHPRGEATIDDTQQGCSHCFLVEGEGLQQIDEIGKKLVFVFDRHAMEGVVKVRVLGGDPKERTSDDVGWIDYAFDPD